MLYLGTLAQHLGIGVVEVLRDKPCGGYLEKVLLHHVVGEVDAGGHREDKNRIDNALDLFATLVIDKLLLRILHQLHPQRGGKGNEHRVDEKEVEGPEEIVEVARGQPESGRTQGRHQCRGNGHTGQHVALLLRRHGHDAGQPAEEGDEHVVDGGRSTGQQLAAGFVQGRNPEVDGRGNHTEECGHRQVAERPLDEFVVVDAQPQTYTHNGAHEGRNQHGADDDRRRVGVQPQRGDKYGKNQNEDGRALELYPGPDSLYRGGFVLSILAHVEVVGQKSFDRIDKIGKCHSLNY